MSEPVFTNLEKRFRRKLAHTARFYPIDVHCHSPLSPCFVQESDGSKGGNITPQDIVIPACEKGLFVLAITDHHRCEYAQEIATAVGNHENAHKTLF